MIGAQWSAVLPQTAAAEAPVPEHGAFAAKAVDWDCDLASGQTRLPGGETVSPPLGGQAPDGFFWLVHPDDRVWLRPAIRRAMAGDGEYDFMFRLSQPGGTASWVRDRAQLERSADGTAVRLRGAVAPIAEGMPAGQVLDAAFDQQAVGCALVSPGGAFLRVNGRLCRMLGRDRDALLRLGVRDLDYAGDGRAGQSLARALHAGRGQAVRQETRALLPDDRIVWLAVTLSYVSDCRGFSSCFLAVVEDVSAETGRAARDAAGFPLGGPMQASPDPVMLLAPDGRLLAINPAGLAALAFADETIARGRAWETLWPPREATEARRVLAGAAATGSGRWTARHGAGASEAWWDCTVWRPPGGSYLFAAARNVTDLHRAQAGLLEAHRAGRQPGACGAGWRQHRRGAR